MELSENDSFNPQSTSIELSIEQEFIMNKTLLTHKSDGSGFDCKILFQAMENVMLHASNINNAVDVNILDNIKNLSSNETMEHSIYKISRAILWQCYNTKDMHTRTLALLEILGSYRWDAKVVIMLTAFAVTYGEFRLILGVYANNSLAASLAVLKNLSWRNVEALRPQFTSMKMLINEMVELAKCVVRFEGLPLKLVLHDDHDCTLVSAAKSQIYLATYWIFRSSLTSASQITDLIAMKQENSNITANAAWGLSSLALRLSTLCSCLRMQVDAFQEHIEQKLYKKLLNLLNDSTQIDNQDFVHLLFSLNDDLPLKDSSSQENVGISKLKHKVVMLLVSKPDLLPIEQTLLILRQTHEHPHHNNIKQDYEVVWVPISSSETWTLDEHTSFDYLSNSLPWLSIRQPWLLNSAVVRIIREEWKFEEKPLMVVLNPQGSVSNHNALDMVLIWGAKALPFSDSREKELWEEEHWNLDLMLYGVDNHFLTKTVEGDHNICICGSSNLDWIKEFESRIEKLRNAGLKLQVIYVGSRNTSEDMQTTLAIVNKDKPFTPLQIQFFWLRLERIKDSILRVGQFQTFANYEILLKQVLELLEDDDRNNWAVFGCLNSKDFVKLKGNKIMEFFDRCPVWAKKVASYGFVGAIRSVFDDVNDTVSCDHTNIVPYDEGMAQEMVVCVKCKRVMNPYVVYQCDGSQKNVSG